MSGYRREIDKSKYMSFLIKDVKSLEKYNDIWEKLIVSKKNSQPV